jgi:uncharacterized protein with HEPN domain
MARKISHFIHDILDAIERIDQVTQGRTFAEFEASWQLRWLVQRGIEIISEASRGTPDEMKSSRPEIPWRKVTGIGNVLRREYEWSSMSCRSSERQFKP